MHILITEEYHPIYSLYFTLYLSSYSAKLIYNSNVNCEVNYLQKKYLSISDEVISIVDSSSVNNIIDTLLHAYWPDKQKIMK